MMRRFAILLVLAVGACCAVSPAQASQPGAPQFGAARSGSDRLNDKDDKPRKPKRPPGPVDGGTDGD